MIERAGKWYPGKVCYFDDTEVDYRAEIEFNEYNVGIITVYGATRDIYLFLSYGKYNSLVLLLENKEYITAFNLYLKKGSCKTKFDDSNPIAGEWEITIESSTILKGRKYFSVKDTFRKLFIEITDGCELIGVCPYDLNKNYVDILMYNDVEIPVKISSIHVNTIVGEFWFNVFPRYIHSKDSFSLGFSHKIQFKPISALKVAEIREVLNQITSFFCLLSGETVTVNELSLIEEKLPDEEVVDFIGICNYTKEKLHVLDSSGMDGTRFKRVSLFKISDFVDLQKALNYWFGNYYNLLNTQKAYSRILLDEEVGVVTINKFLAAMQIIEGYAQAFAHGEKEYEDFQKQKDKIISMLTEEEDIELIVNGLGFSGIKFRKAVKDFLYKGCKCIVEISKTKFLKKNEALVDRIVNDRNFYTHSSNQIAVQMNFDEMINVTTICKQIYRILVLKDMGVSQSLLLQRINHDRLSMAVFEKILDIKLPFVDEELTKYDSAMWNFSN